MIVFPALEAEAEETHFNVSHAYTQDHQDEDKLFEDVTQVSRPCVLKCCLNVISIWYEVSHTAN